jgi:hypothetical protein
MVTFRILRRLLEEVVIGNGATGRQRAPLFRDSLDRGPKLGLRLEQLVARAPVLARLTGKADVGVHGQRGRVYAAALLLCAKTEVPCPT